ncbi:MAG: N-acetylmuramoyl-L-alanine amidase [Candidatus Epulonipiscioides saccharophilum]|nr:MAG: N-acetylmuramoyl-L-alanine amidase [Epulopiscium sp. AS2M-Bin001]
MRIVLDAGHGGVDPGAIGQAGLRESEIVLTITLKLAQLLESVGIEVILTRTTNQYISLEERVRIANDSKADYFISIHANSATNKLASGAETYAYSKVGKSYILALDVQEDLIKSTGFLDRGVKTANFAVLRETDMPAILVEIGFLSNAQEESKLSNKEFLNRIAMAIYNGIAQYLNLEIKQQVDEVAAIKQLVQLGIISQMHDVNEKLTWGQFATIILRVTNMEDN